jgi:hypothetical protein
MLTYLMAAVEPIQVAMEISRNRQEGTPGVFCNAQIARME